jgi:predicted Zn-dependent peptidase
MAMINAEITRMWTEVVPTAEMTNAREYAKGIMYLSAENMESRMTRLAHNEFQFGRHIPVEEVAAAIDGTSAEEVATLADKLFRGTPFSTVVLGPITPDAISWERGN